MELNKRTLMATLIAILTLNVGLVQNAQACSRVLHVSDNGKHVVTGRNMDWYEDLESNIWLFPRGMKKDGAAGKSSKSVKWTSKYGSVITAGFDGATSDGLNEKGLMVNLLYLAEADFGKPDKTRPAISWAAYAQYLLDNYATVAEAVAGERGDHLQIVSSPIPGSAEKPPTLHFSLSDQTGDSAVFEHLKGKLVIHHGKQYNVMTNSPTYDQQIALNAYWESIGGKIMLPGTIRAADRFVRASYYEKQLPDPKTDRQAMANVMSVMRNASAPFGKTDPDRPNIAPTIWRTAADHINKIYYFESTLSPSIVWVKLDKLNFKQGAPVKRLKLVDNYNLSGDVSNEFKERKAFKFFGPR